MPMSDSLIFWIPSLMMAFRVIECPLCLPSMLSLRAFCTASSEATILCSSHLSPLLLRMIFISRSLPRREAKCGNSMTIRLKNKNFKIQHQHNTINSFHCSKRKHVVMYLKKTEKRNSVLGVWIKLLLINTSYVRLKKKDIVLSVWEMLSGQNLCSIFNAHFNYALTTPPIKIFIHK